MSKVSVTLAQAANLVVTCGTTNTFIFQGEPGIGKSSLRHPIMQKLGWPADRFVYVDAALLDTGDMQYPANRGDHIEFIPNKMFKHDEPVVIMLDEFGKAPRPVKNAMLTLLLEHRIGSTHLPEGSIVFGTTNLATDGVGDVMEGHARNRVTMVKVSKPTADEVIEWGVDNGMEPTIMAWMHEYPQCLDSYTNYPAGDKIDNPYIFNPRSSVQGACFTPRSGFHAGEILKQRHNIPDDALIAALAGTVGEAAARDLEAFVALNDDLTPFAVCVEKPDTAKVPDSPIAATILSLGAVMRIDNDNINNWIKYMRRLPRETQFMFAQNAMRSKKAGLVARATEFTKWARENSWAV